MAKSAEHQPTEQLTNKVTPLRTRQPTRATFKVIPEIVACNGASKAHEDLWARTRQAADMADQAALDAQQAEAAQEEAEVTYKTAQAENPERSAPRPRQWLIAGAALLLDGVACYFAAEALGAGPGQTLAWAVLFLALLGIGEFTLDHFSDGRRGVWRAIAGTLCAFVGLLGILRYSFLATVGSEGLVTALIGAGLFTLTTAGFVIIGYRALRMAETGATWKARRHVKACAAGTATAHRRLAELMAKRDRLARAYLSRIRARLIQTCPANQLPEMEQAVWAHLIEGNLS
jgi:hypothetical protein